jgi:hypothetical protein
MYRVPNSQNPLARAFSSHLALALFAGLLGLAAIWPQTSELARLSYCPNDQGVVTPDSPTAPTGISRSKHNYGWPLTFRTHEMDLCANSIGGTWNLLSLALNVLCYMMIAVAAAWMVNRIQRRR